ncbi:hypothetical protein [Halomarina rubra]|uniref:Uncharacterized protein n=1 Tax=Halomarina rubra TaxID=2071873 RepID=A0ABD6AY29_9EURY|nr:hypothetical protein [Halomarina rubra]
MPAGLPDSNSVERLVSDFEALEEVAQTDSTFVIGRTLDTYHPFQQYDIESLLEGLTD